MREGWELKTLSDVCNKIFAGGDKPKDNFSKFKTDNFSIPIFANGEKNKGLYGYTDISKVNKPSITVSARGTIGYSEIRREPFFPIVRLIVLIPNTEIVLIEYLKYLIGNIEFKKSGTSIPQLTVPMIKKYQTPIPPLAEQQQIVAILDKAFTAIDTAKANIEKNIENTKKLQVSVTNKIFNSVGKSNKLSVDEITDFITDYVANGSFASLKKNVKYTDEESYAILLRLTDHSKKFKGNFKYVDKQSFDFLKKSVVLPNDIIISNVGARLGTTFRAPNLNKPMTLGPNAILIKAEKYGDYLFCWLQSAFGQKEIKSIVGGAGQPKFNKTQFKKIEIPIPHSKNVREKLVEKINKSEAEFESLRNCYSRKLESLEELKKSILQKAFAGELTKEEIAI